MKEYFGNIKLSKDWEWTKLERVVHSFDGSYGEDNPSDNSIEVTVLGVGNVTNDGRVRLAKSEKRYLKTNEETAILFEDDLFVVKSSGSSANIRSGKTAICPPELSGKIACSNFLFRLVPDKTKVDPKYLWILLNSQFSKEFVRQIAGSTTYPNIKWKTFKDFYFPNPKNPSLRKDISFELINKIEIIEKMNRNALEQKKAVDALQQKQLDEIFSLDRFSKLKFKKLKDFKPEISAGKAVSSVGGYYTTSGVPYLQVNNIDNNRGFIPNKIIFISEASNEALAKSEVLKNDVLINIVGPPIGKVCWYPNDKPANINQAVVRVRCPKEINHKFLTYLLRTSHYYNHFVEVKVGARQWNVSSTNIADLLIPEVPYSKQLEMVAEIEAKNIDNLKTQILKQLEAIEALPAAILREVFEFNKN